MHPSPQAGTLHSRPPTIWISATETSADMHGAELIAALKKEHPAMKFRGMGGPSMRRTPFTADFAAEELSVMGLTEVIEFLPRILKLLRRTRRRLEEVKPDAVVLIDSPDYHFRIAKMAHRLSIPVIYYIAPQAWAWRKGRVKFLRRFVDKLLCILPFEEPWFRKHGVDTEYVGHPFMDHFDFSALREIPVEEKRIALLPGSRMKEVKALLPHFAEAARLLLELDPELEFVLVRAPHIASHQIWELWPEKLPLGIIESENRLAEISRCNLVLAASGTATLECALLNTPTIVTYIVSPMSYRIGKLLIDVPFIAMPNLILGERVFPELIQHEVTGRALAEIASRWLSNASEREGIRKALAPLPEKLGQGGASKNAAGAVLNILKNQPDQGA